VIYYGGIPNARVRTFDGLRKRPGLPEDVAALVDTIAASSVGLTLVNLNPRATREAVIQAGALGEHRFRSARFDSSETPYPAPQGAYAADQPVLTERRLRIDGTHLQVNLPPATQIHLTLEMERYVNSPSYLPSGSEGLYG
jgi:hypothetical protein